MKTIIACIAIALLAPGAWAQSPTTEQPATTQTIQTIVESAFRKQKEKPIQPKFTALKARQIVDDAAEMPAPSNNSDSQIPKTSKRARLKSNRDLSLIKAISEPSSEKPEVFLIAYQNILNVCNDGFDYLSQEIKGNMLRDKRMLYLSALAGLISGGTGSLVMAKTAGVLTAGVAAYKQGELLTPGTEDSNQTLQSMMEEIREELSLASFEFNQWFIADSSGDQGSKRLVGMKSSLLAMNNACSFY